MLTLLDAGNGQSTQDEELQRGNITAVRLNESHHLCSIHVEDSQFMNPDQKNTLIWCAIPTLFSVPNPPSKVTVKRKLPDYHLDTNDYPPISFTVIRIIANLNLPLWSSFT